MPAKTNELLQACSNVLRNHSPFYGAWTEDERLRCLQWHADMGLMLAAEDPSTGPGNIQRDLSFCLVRFLPDIQHRLRRYFSDPAGHIVYLDYVYKGSNAGHLAMFLEGVKRWGTGKTLFGWHREDEPEDTYHLVPLRFGLKFCKKLC